MKVFIPMSDGLIEEYPELLDGPCIPYPSVPDHRRRATPEDRQGGRGARPQDDER